MPLWGFADLHAHPTSHLGFGAERNPDGTFEFGIFWGKPGLRWDSVSLAADLPPCDVASHTVIDDGGPVRKRVRETVITAISRMTGDLRHEREGYPSFSGWPPARSLMHQQMHVSWLRRAWEGGLRLMIACVTDNQALAMLWHRAHGKPPKPFDPDFDYHSARAQLAFIRELAAANSSWMEIATSPAQARSIIGANKLALLLGLEMDTLSLHQVIALRDEFGIRHIIPIHMADNCFGGVAVYQDLFNTNNHYLTGSFYQVVADPNLAFRLSWPEYLRYIGVGIGEGNDLVKGGVYEPHRIAESDYRSLGYPATGGHKNARGLERPVVEMLMRQGLLIDLAHMSEASQEDAVALAEAHRYPMMNSHTGLRPDDGRPGASERAMADGLARRLGALGGVMGLGTAREDYPVGDPVQTWIHEYRAAVELMGNRGVALGTDMNGFAPQIPFSRAARAVSYPLSVARRIAVFLGMGGGPLLERSQVGGKTFEFSTDGLAHYGMLPDFLQAVYDRLGGGGESANRWVGQLYRTAEDVVQMWERVEEAAREMRLSMRPPGTVPLDLYWSWHREDNFTTSTEIGRRDAQAAGYQLARTEGFVFETAREGTRPLNLFWGAERGDNFSAATEEGRRDAEIARYQAVRTEGFLYSTQQPGTVPLRLYWSEARGDNFVTATEAGRRDAEAAAYRFVRVEGFVFPRSIGLRAHDGHYVGAEHGGGGGVDASRGWLREHEAFEVVYLDGGQIALRTFLGFYLCAENGGGREVVANRTWIGDWERFTLVNRGGSRIALRTPNGLYLCAEGGGGRGIVANRRRADLWETFELMGV